MKIKALVILGIIIVSLLPAFYISNLLERFIQPRKSFGRLMGYLISVLAFVFVYTFMIVFFIMKLFPAS